MRACAPPGRNRGRSRDGHQFAVMVRIRNASSKTDPDDEGALHHVSDAGKQQTERRVRENA
jgi:hypothetical protein